MEPFRIPGTLGPEIVVRRSAIGSIKVFADGQPIKPRRSGLKVTYEIPLADGTTKPIELDGQFTGLRAVVDGAEIPLEPTLRPWELLLIFLPFVLAGIGGAIGAGIGAIAFLINGTIVRTSARGPVRVAGMLAVTAVAGLIWFGVAFLLSPIPSLTTGTCLNGIGEGAVVTTSRSLPCGSPHDNEVIATFDYPAGGTFPGEAEIRAFAEAKCIPAFATYVGIDFDVSSLDMIPVAPSNETWLKGDRQVACVVLTTDGTQLTESVKESGK